MKDYQNYRIVYHGIGSEQIFRAILGNENYDSLVKNIRTLVKGIGKEIRETLDNLLIGLDNFALAYAHVESNVRTSRVCPDRAYGSHWSDSVYFSKRNNTVTRWRVKGGKIEVDYGMHGEKRTVLDPNKVQHNTADYVAKKLGGVRDKSTLRKIAKELERLLTGN